MLLLLGLSFLPFMGFSFDQIEVAASDNQNILLKRVNRLNESLGNKPFVENMSKNVKRRKSKADHFKQNIFTLFLSSFSQKLNQKSDSFLKRDELLDDISGKALGFDLRLKSNSKYQFYTSFQSRSLDVMTTPTLNFSEFNENIIDLHGGLFYSLKKEMDLFMTLGISQKALLNHVANGAVTTQQVVRVSLPQLRLGLTGSFAKSKKWSLDYLGSLSYLLGRESNSLSVESGFELYADLTFNYWLSQRYFIKSSLFLKNSSLDVDGLSRDFNADVSLKESGFKIGLGTIF